MALTAAFWGGVKGTRLGRESRGAGIVRGVCKGGTGAHCCTTTREQGACLEEKVGELVRTAAPCRDSWSWMWGCECNAADVVRRLGIEGVWWRAEGPGFRV